MMKYNPITCMMEEIMIGTKDSKAMDGIKYFKKLNVYRDGKFFGGFPNMVRVEDLSDSFIVRASSGDKKIYHKDRFTYKGIGEIPTRDAKVKDVSSDQVARDLKNMASVVGDAIKSFYDAEDKEDKKRMQDNIRMLKIQQKRLSKIGSDLEFVITHLEDLI